MTVLDRAAPAPARPGPAGRLPAWARSDRSAVLAATLTFLAAWQVVSLLSETFPGPASVVGALVDEATGGHLLDNFLVSMRRFLVGMGIAVLVGVVLGLLIGASRLMEAFLNDVNVVGLSIPAVIWALLCTMWFGFGDLAPIVTVVLSATPFVTVNVAAGVRSVPPELRHMSRSFGVAPLRRLRHVVLPAVAGYVFAGIRFGVMSGWNGLLLSEWFGASEGVGWRARYWYDANRMPGFLAWVAFFILFMVLTDRAVLERINRRVFRWRDDTGPQVRAAA